MGALAARLDATQQQRLMPSAAAFDLRSWHACQRIVVEAQCPGVVESIPCGTNTSGCAHIERGLRMSVRSALDFYRRLSRDDEYFAAILAAEGQAQRLELAQTEGYEFTQSELEEATVAFVEERESSPDFTGVSTDRASRLGMSLVDVIMVRVTAEYGDVCFFEDSGQLRL